MVAIIVGDDKVTIEDISIAFNMCFSDCILETTDSGTECLELIKEVRPDIIILDNDLLENDSFNLIRQIRSLHRTPIVFVSGSDNTSDLVMAFESGADEYIKKPIRLLEFMARSKKFVRRKRIKNMKEHQSIVMKGGFRELNRHRKVN